METKLKLNSGESLKRISSRTKGFMGETDIVEYQVVNQYDDVLGTVTYTDHMAVRGCNRTQTVEQRDSEGNIIVAESW